VTVSDKGTGQGSVISPLLANLYLHYVFDLWAERWRRREAAGDMIIVRYADDLIVGFEHETDASRFLDEMRKRLQEFALSLHSEKTRLIEFGCFAAKNRKRRRLGKPETFTFLGFTFICSKTRRGKFQIKRKSRRDRMQAKLQAIKQELRRSMHQPIPQQGRWLQQVVTGYFNYHAVPTNGSTLTAFLFHVTNLWRRTLRQRSQKDWTTWERIKRLADDWLPKPRILHPWPESRFAVRHPRWEPYAHSVETLRARVRGFLDATSAWAKAPRGSDRFWRTFVVWDRRSAVVHRHSLHVRHRFGATDPGPVIRRALLDIWAVKSSILERSSLRIGEVFALL
jgi:RNA-directed DNA polymerase